MSASGTLQEIVNTLGVLSRRIDDCFANIVGIGTNTREKLTSARTYYVRTDGSNSNNGLTNTSSGAFLTIQKAIDVIWGTLDTSIYNVTIQIADGTYTGASVASGVLVGAGIITVQGNNATPSNVFINTVAGSDCFLVEQGAYLRVQDLKMATTTSGYCLHAINGIIGFNNVEFATSATTHISADQNGQVVCCATGFFAGGTRLYSITGGALQHMASFLGGVTDVRGTTVTLTGTPAFSNGFATATRQSYIIANANTYTGAATGKRYISASLSFIDTNGGGENYFPGNALGNLLTGGRYDNNPSFLSSRNTAQFDKANTTLADITGISISLLAGRSYGFRVVLYTTSNVASGVKAAITGTCTATSIVYEATVLQAGVSVAPGTSRATALGVAVADVTPVTAATIVIEGTITVNAAGNLKAQFADNAGTNTSSVLVGSNMLVEDITP